jgi:hypothetical protein
MCNMYNVLIVRFMVRRGIVHAMRRVSQHMVRDVERELNRLERERDALDRAIARLRQIAIWLRRDARLGRSTTEHRLAVPQSLTNVCRAALRTSRHGLTTREVKQFLTSNGFDWDPFTNPMSAIHTVLKRLVKQNEATAAVGEDGRRRFVWHRPQSLAGTPTPTQAEEASRIEHLLDGTVDWRGKLRKSRRPSARGRTAGSGAFRKGH